MTVARALSTQARIIFSVASRDVLLRTKDSPLGVFGQLIEPLASILIMTAIMTLVRLRVPDVGDYILLFVMTGAMPLSMFRVGMTNAERAFRKMRRVLVLPSMRPLDLTAGGVLTTFVTLTSLFILITLVFKLFYRVPDPEVATGVFIPLICNVLMGMGMSLINLTIKSWFPYWSFIIGMLLMPLPIFSGMFYVGNHLPQSALNILYYNPFFHSTELCRTFFFHEYHSEIFDPYYYGGWVVGMLGVGLLCERAFRYRLLSVKG